YAKLEGALKAAVTEARADWPAATIDQSAQLLLSVYSGLRVMARARVDRDRLEGAKEAAIANLSQ
ncbi:MAG: TetR/AcrR family transcriptional regulator, partial [Geminicoccaceae bacterium]